MVPGPKVGLIIGKGGETIKQLQDKSGARMTVIQDGSMNQEQEKPLRISGDPQSVEVFTLCFLLNFCLKSTRQGTDCNQKVGGNLYFRYLRCYSCGTLQFDKFINLYGVACSIWGLLMDACFNKFV